jgi:hypothetical protein
LHITGWIGKNVAEGRNEYEIVPPHTESIYNGNQDNLLAYKCSKTWGNIIHKAWNVNHKCWNVVQVLSFLQWCGWGISSSGIWHHSIWFLMFQYSIISYLEGLKMGPLCPLVTSTTKYTVIQCHILEHLCETLLHF